MSSWFNTTDSLEHISPLPTGLSPEKAIKTLHNHVFYIKVDPHMIKYEPIPPPSDVEPTLPDGIQDLAKGEPAYFSVTDKVHTLPAGLWDSDVVSIYEFFNLEKGFL
ncbi:hypothetical protein PT974_08765 [Cladobotryum mycophilum]|uniref:DUF7053 domain-containing protein n=1 Tax=Cladobotryum mycophilum TaxID=491253 RepID=A0ABR0SF81_9HYPO